MMTLSNAYYAGAIAAMRSSRRCEREASLYDLLWYAKRMADAQENRERAIWYLQRRKLLCFEQKHMEAA